MQLQALSVGCEIDVWKSQSGEVHSCFDHGINLWLEGELWSVLSASRHDVPFGIRLAGADRPGGLGVQAADRVYVRAGYVRMGPRIVDCRAAARWVPVPWGRPAKGLDARLGFVERMARLRAWSSSAVIADDLIHGLCSSDADLTRAVRRSVGRGPGLTPSGDDVLVGMLAVLTSGAAGPAAVATASRLVDALAPELRWTPDISRHLLNQAARGLPGRALHELGKALCQGASHETLARALESVLDTGCTSGADACLGLVAASRLMFFPAKRLAS